MLNTVKVPKKFEPIFRKAQEYVSQYFRQKKVLPSKGLIDVGGQRYIMVRAAAMSVEFFKTIKNLYKGDEEEDTLRMARDLLFDIAHSIGKSDARDFHKRMGLKDPIEKLSAGPVHFAHMGWAFVNILPQSNPVQDESYYLIYEHPYSFEAESWMKLGRKVDFPVCIMNAGYSSGWCEESFGIELIASEITCKAKGDDHCRFIMAPPAKIDDYIQRYLRRDHQIAKGTKKYEIPTLYLKRQLKAQLDAVKESEEKYRFLFEKSQTVNVLVGTNGKIVNVNQTAAKSLGYERNDLIGKDIIELVVPGHRGRIAKQLAKNLNGEETGSLEVDIISGGGIRTLLFSEGNARLFERGKLVGELISAIDITERRMR